MSNEMAYAVVSDRGYAAIMEIVGWASAIDAGFDDAERPSREAFDIANGFPKGYDLHAHDCCGAFDRILSAAGYEKRGGVLA